MGSSATNRHSTNAAHERDRQPYDPDQWERRLAEARVKRAAALRERAAAGAERPSPAERRAAATANSRDDPARPAAPAPREDDPVAAAPKGRNGPGRRTRAEGTQTGPAPLALGEAPLGRGTAGADESSTTTPDGGDTRARRAPPAAPRATSLPGALRDTADRATESPDPAATPEGGAHARTTAPTDQPAAPQHAAPAVPLSGAVRGPRTAGTDGRAPSERLADAMAGRHRGRARATAAAGPAAGHAVDPPLDLGTAAAPSAPPAAARPRPLVLLLAGAAIGGLLTAFAAQGIERLRGAFGDTAAIRAETSVDVTRAGPAPAADAAFPAGQDLTSAVADLPQEAPPEPSAEPPAAAAPRAPAPPPETDRIAALPQDPPPAPPRPPEAASQPPRPAAIPAVSPPQRSDGLDAFDEPVPDLSAIAELAAALDRVVLGDDPLAAAVEPAPASVSRVVVHVPPSVPRSVRDGIDSALRQGHWPTEAHRTSPYTIGDDQVRYFHARDRAAAEQLAAQISAEPRNFTSYTPSPDPGLLEVWLSGRAPQVTRRQPPNPAQAIVNVLNRISRSLGQPN